MILIGRDLSPFVRRTAIVFDTLELKYERRKLASMDPAEFAEIKKTNPLGRVPALLLADDEVLIDSHAIIDFALETADTGHKLCPSGGPARREVLRASAFAVGVMEKGVASSYEIYRRPEELIHQPWLDHILDQVEQGLIVLEEMASTAGWGQRDIASLADINAVVAFDFISLIRPELAKAAAPEALPALSARMNERPAFKNNRWQPR
jgi:glutathione S-transferase